MIAFIKPLLS